MSNAMPARPPANISTVADEAQAVYQNGARINEAFGDVVNWDLIPANAIDQTTKAGQIGSMLLEFTSVRSPGLSLSR